MKSDFQWNKPIAQIATEKTGGKPGLLFLANEFRNKMEPYVPAENLVLSQNVRTYVEGNKGIIHYMKRYAHYQYKGLLYVDPKTKKGAFYNGEIFWSRPGTEKIPTTRSIKHSTFRHLMATSEWDKAAWTAHKDEIVQSYQNYIKRGGKK